MKKHFGGSGESHPRLARLVEADVRSARFTLSGAQLVIAREYAFVMAPAEGLCRKD
jgi:hypothetical protein